MYQVVELYGQFEPWWFLDDWKDDMVEYQEFTQFDQALDVFRRQWTYFRMSHPHYKSKSNLLAAFWDKEDQTWCEDCDEPLQNYRSLMLLENWEPVSLDHYQLSYDKQNDKPKAMSSCRIKKIG